MPVDIPQLKEALERWESYLAGIHDCDLEEPEAIAVLHINEAARAVVEATTITLHDQPCHNCGSNENHTLKCCNVCDHSRRVLVIEVDPGSQP